MQSVQGLRKLDAQGFDSAGCLEESDSKNDKASWVLGSKVGKVSKVYKDPGTNTCIGDRTSKFHSTLHLAHFPRFGKQRVYLHWRGQR